MSDEVEIIIKCNQCGFVDEFTVLGHDKKIGDTWEQPCNGCGHNWSTIIGGAPA